MFTIFFFSGKLWQQIRNCCLYWIHRNSYHAHPLDLTINSKPRNSESECVSDEKQSKMFVKPVQIGPKIRENSEFLFSELVVGFDEQF
jgi:hypothetical protein